MTTYVEPQDAQLGDVVQDMVGFAIITGEIVGIDTQGPAILVRWRDSRAMDVYSLESPVWSCFGIVRKEPLKCESCGAAIMADESDCPSCGQKNLNEASFEQTCVEVAGSVTDRLPDIIQTVRVLTRPLAIKLPWATDDDELPRYMDTDK